MVIFLASPLFQRGEDYSSRRSERRRKVGASELGEGPSLSPSPWTGEATHSRTVVPPTFIMRLTMPTVIFETSY
jgi:hypothetical protein